MINKKYFNIGFIVILYSIITLLFFYPFLPKLNKSIIGPPGDNQKFVWNMWYIKHALTNKLPLTYTNYIYYPRGHTLLFDAVSWFNAFLSVPLQFLFSLPLVYNIIILLTFPISGIGAYLLCYYFTKNKLISFIGGYIYAFSPFRFVQSLDHFTLTNIQFIPFFILFYFKVMKEKKTKYLILSIAFFVLSSLCSWYFFLILSVFLVIEPIIHFIINKNIDFKRLIKTALIIFLSIIILSPLIFPMITTYFNDRYTSPYQSSGHSSNVADLLGFITPQYPLFLSNFLKLNFNVIGGYSLEEDKYNPITQVFLGYTNILLLLYLLVFKFKENKKIILLFFSFAILAMGIELVVNNHHFPFIKLPYYLLYIMPITSIPSSPGTMIVIAYLFLGIISAKALVKLGIIVEKNKFLKKFKINRNVFILVVFILILFEFYSLSYMSTPYKLPPIYNYLDKENKGAILEVPFEYNYLDINAFQLPREVVLEMKKDYFSTGKFPNISIACNQCYMLYQTIHQRKIANGLLSRQLSSQLKNELSFDDMPSFKEELINNNIRYIIAYKLFTKKEHIKALDNYFERIKEDRENILYSVS